MKTVPRTEEENAALPWRALGVVRGFARALFDLVLPPVCMACRKPVADQDALCPSCWRELSFIEEPFCARLGIPFAYDLGHGALSAEAIADPPPFERARAVAVYRGVARDIVHALKYRDRTELATVISRLMTRSGGELLSNADIIVPVPLHPGRLWQRRFNQAAMLATSIATVSGHPVEPLVLRRIRATRRQVGLNMKERDRNVRGAFRINPEHRGAITGRRIVLVDDVYTTGATVKACTRALMRAGAQSVDVLVFARVVGDVDSTL